MVARTLVKLFRTTAAKESGKFPGIKPDYQLPALTMDELRHHYALAPLYGYTAFGFVVCAWYILRMCTVKDSTLSIAQKTFNVKDGEQIPLFMFGAGKTSVAPPTKPDLPPFRGYGKAE